MKLYSVTKQRNSVHDLYGEISKSPKRRPTVQYIHMYVGIGCHIHECMYTLTSCVYTPHTQKYANMCACMYATCCDWIHINTLLSAGFCVLPTVDQTNVIDSKHTKKCPNTVKPHADLTPR